jgi:hypothetical protein
MIIKPTVGRVVWFWESIPNDVNVQPQAAIIAHVWSDRCVNLAILDPNGVPWPKPPTSITLVQEGDVPPDGIHCTWMPYQVGQAKAVGQTAGQATAILPAQGHVSPRTL